MPRKLIFSFVILFVFFLRGVAAEKKYEGEGAYMKKIVKSDEEWRRYLTPEQFKIARGRRTEAPFCGLLNDNKRPGIYYCVCCALPLFTSKQKFVSDTGWPSFFTARWATVPASSASSPTPRWVAAWPAWSWPSTWRDPTTAACGAAADGAPFAHSDAGTAPARRRSTRWRPASQPARATSGHDAGSAPARRPAPAASAVAAIAASPSGCTGQQQSRPW